LIQPGSNKHYAPQARRPSGVANCQPNTLVWLVIGLALFRQMPLWQVVQEMALTLEGKELPAPSASVQARQRLGPEPLEHLFSLLTQA